MKRFVCGVFVLGMCAVGFGQAAAGDGSATVSSMMQPALGNVQQATAGLQPDKWKLPNPVKTQTSSDIASIQRDLSGTLPGLISEADAAPGSIAAALPVVNNVNALYDVLLRVAEKAQLTAPEQQTAVLGQALQGLEDARKSLNQRLLANASATEKQMRDLRTNLKTQTDAANAANAQVATLQATKAAPCLLAKPAAKKAAVKKPATATAKPVAATTTPAKP